MKIAIDAHAVGGKLTGNETYISNLIKALLLLDQKNEYIIFYSNPEVLKKFDLTNSGHSPVQLFPSNPLIRIPITLPLQLLKHQAEMVLVQYAAPPFCPCPTVVMVHDIAYHFFPEYYRFFEHKRLELLTPASMRQAARVLVDSNATKQDILKVYNLEENKIVVTPLGVSSDFRQTQSTDQKTAVAKKYNLPPEFILFVGNIQPRKNLTRLVKAFAKLKTQAKIKEKLVIVGQPKWLDSEVFSVIRESRLEEEICFTGYVAEADLPLIYNLAGLLVYPSLYEGFGLPCLEAMACGVPLVASDIPSIREFASGAAVLVDPYNENAMADSIKTVLDSPMLKKKLAAEGLKRASQYTWRKTAEKTLAVFEDVYSIKETTRKK